MPYDGVDQDCDGADADDLDADGYPALAAGGTDCDDTDSAIHPGATEAWADGYTDNDCVAGNEGGREEFSEPDWRGQADGGQLGYRVGALGDVDGDGVAEFWASPLFDPTLGAYAGSVYVLHADSAADLSEAGRLLPDRDRTFLGVSGAVGPDVDGDGSLDVAFAGDGHDGGRGAVWLFDGSALVGGAELAVGAARAAIVGDSVSTYLGHSVAVLPDFAGDGVALLAVTRPSWAGSEGAEQGQVLLFPWDADGEVAAADALGGTEGYYAHAQLGQAVIPTEDVDDDGLADYLVQFGSGDLVAVMPGGLESPRMPDDALLTVTGTGAFERGSCVPVGDIDGDAAADLGCGTEGGAWFFTRLDERPVRTVTDADFWLGAGSQTVQSLVDVGDRDGDGRSETFVAATDGTDGTATAGFLTGEDADRGGEAELETIDLTVAHDGVAARYGFAAALVAADEVNPAFLLVGGPGDDLSGVDRGGVVRIAIPE